MAVDMFLKIDSLEGESRDKGYKNWIDVESYSWGATQSGSQHTGGGGGTGKVSIQDLHVVKKMDKCTADIMRKCCDGTHFNKIELVCRKAGGDQPLEYVKWELKKAIVSSYQTGSSGGEGADMEQISFNFAEVKMEYAVQSDTGGIGETPKFGWNVEQNAPL
ncbi:MAG: type VI secretion system tube protein Hcp [Planctomycetes bacterium]|nr:type VI secretion system tube protein Hcp [Planctomycetota bacterium]